MKTDGRPTVTCVMAIILLATVVDGMDASIVNVMLPVMSGDLDMTVASSAFVSVAYIIPIAGLMLPLAKIADRAGVRRMFLAGTVVFTAASVGCALSANGTELIAMRFVQGTGAALMVSTTPIMVVRLLPETYKARGMACVSAGSGVAIVLGPTLGGIIGELLSWHWVFLLNVPLGAALLLMGSLWLPAGGGDHASAAPDLPSAGLMFSGVSLTIMAMYGYVEEFLTVPAAVASGALGAVLTMVAFRRCRRVGNPLVHPRLLADRRFVSVSVVFLISTVIASGTLYLMPYYMTVIEGMDTVAAGLLLAFMASITVVLAPPTGRWCDSRGCRTPASVAVGLRVVFSVMLWLIEPAMGMGFLLVTFVVMGVSFGISGTSQSTRMVEEADWETSGDAGSMAQMVNYVGSGIGLAAYAVLFSLFCPGGVGHIDGMSADAFLDGFHGAFVGGAVMAVAALALSLMVRDRRGVPDETI